MTKAIARHGLGLYIYAGEDMPEHSEDAPKAKQEAPVEPKEQPKPAPKGMIAAAIENTFPNEASITGKLDTHSESYGWHKFKIKGHPEYFSAKEPALVETLINFGKLKKEVTLFYTTSKKEGKDGKVYDNHYITRAIEPEQVPF